LPTKEEFIELLSETSSILKKEAVLNKFKSSSGFENRVREVISDLIVWVNLVLKLNLLRKTLLRVLQIVFLKA